MNDTEFQRIAADPQARTANYQQMVVAYFDRVTDTYRRAWGLVPLRPVLRHRDAA